MRNASVHRLSIRQIAVGMAAVLLLNPMLTSAAESRPNILFIAVDDLRPELACYGAEHIQSPNIDRFAQSGLRFDRAYCQQAVCNPSRTSLMTGLRPDTTGVTTNHAHFRSKMPDVVTLPQHFKQHGYHAAAIGKLYHGVFPEGSSNTHWDTMGDPQSWSEPAIRFGPRYYYTEAGIAAAQETFRRVYKPENPSPDAWTQKLVFGPATESPDVADNVLYDGKVADAAVTALRGLAQQPEQPFFLALGFIKPHSPYVAPKEYFDLYRDVEIASNMHLPNGAPRFAGHRSGELRRYTDQPAMDEIAPEKQQRVRHAYYACVSYIDAQIGRVLDELDHLGLSDNTIVSLYGDHGYHLGEHGLWGKTTNFELDTRVPLILRAPGMKATGRASSSLVELVDLYPTLVELAGLPVADHLEGMSLVKLLDDPTQTVKNAAMSQYPRGGHMGYSMRTPTHRLTQWIDQHTGQVTATELYDYADGLVETENLAGAAGSQVKELTAQMATLVPLSTALVTKPSQAAGPPAPKSRIGALRTSFEEQQAGEFERLETELGTWTSVAGTPRIDDKHASAGGQCLQLPGGAETIVELELADGVATMGNLSFRAERWTKRTPFSFRIEKESGGKWAEIYNGDNTVRVGRGFLSELDVSLNDPNITRLRFSVQSPPNTGILIDAIQIALSEPQKIIRAEVIPFALPMLVGAAHSPLLKIRIETVGRLNPIALTELNATLEGTSDLRDIAEVQAFYCGTDASFTAAKAFGASRQPAGDVTFRGEQLLAEGANYVWVACTLKPSANILHRVSTACRELKFSNGKSVELSNSASIQTMGVRVRDAGDDGVHTYRIPGLATTQQGSLIAVYDVRRRSSGDLPGDIDVGMSRSTDGGRSWQPMKIIMDMGDDPEFHYDGIGDPTVLVDAITGTIWCGATWSHGNRSWHGSQPGLEPADTGQFMLVKSIDDGLSWSKPINITPQVKKPEWSFLLQGPGKGISLSDGTLVMPAQYQDPPNPEDSRANRLPHSAFVFSRDHGQTWDVSTGAYDDTTEAQVVELADGQIMINCRYNRESKRVVMTTTDLGKTWIEHPTNRNALVEPSACMASLINVGRELKQRGDSVDWQRIYPATSNDSGALQSARNLTSTESRVEMETEPGGQRDKRPARFEVPAANDFLLFSNPDSLRGRNHITIKASLDGGKTWPLEHQLLLDEGNGRGYSCMTMIDAQTVGILYEGSQAQMTFQQVKLADILNPPKNQKTKNPAQLARKDAFRKEI